MNREFFHFINVLYYVNTFFIFFWYLFYETFVLVSSIFGHNENVLERGRTMNKNGLLYILITIACSIALIKGVQAKQNYSTEAILYSGKADLTNDGKEEMISLKGIPFDNGSSYYKETELKVILQNGNVLQKHLTGGTNGNLVIHDLNGDKKKDLLIQIPIGTNQDSYEYFLLSIKNQQLTEIDLPTPVSIEGYLDNDYKAYIKLKDKDKYKKISLSKRKKLYEKLGIYHKGILNEPREVVVTNYQQLEPVRLKNGKYGLKGIQKILGPTEEETIATVTSTWKYHPQKGWTLIKTKLDIE